MNRQQVVHALVYRLGLTAVFLFFLGFMVAVVIIAQTRNSGVTSIDAEKMEEVRATNLELAEAERQHDSIR